MIVVAALNLVLDLTEYLANLVLDGVRSARLLLEAVQVGEELQVLFAKHVVIPICDGYKSEGDFQSLLNGLHEEFQPIGLYEEWLVLKIAECMWRLRRATRCESGSVREATIWDQHRDKNQIIAGLASELCLLGEAEEQLRDSGTLSRKIYEQVMPFVEEERRKTIQSEKGNESVEGEIDNDFS